jgi:hypothetical protein
MIGQSKTWSTSHIIFNTSLNPVPNAQVCVYYKITTINYISKTSLYITFRMYSLGPWLLKILMFALLVTRDIELKLQFSGSTSKFIWPFWSEHAFPRQWHMHMGGGEGVFISTKVFFPVWCHPWMDDETNGWIDESRDEKSFTTSFTICTICNTLLYSCISMLHLTNWANMQEENHLHEPSPHMMTFLHPILICRVTYWVLVGLL